MKQKDHMAALKAAFPLTVPVMTGYLFLGAAYGILMQDKGYGPGWALLMSVTIYAGSMQFVGVALLTSVFQPFYALLLTLMVNARHLFYGISMLHRYGGMGKVKPYLIFGLTDETFSIVCSTPPPKEANGPLFYFWITLLDQLYWIAGSVFGAAFGGFLPFDTAGLDFALTALFVVIFLNQWLEQKRHLPALIGVGASAACLILFGAQNFILPSMAAILVLLGLLRGNLEQKEVQPA